MSEFEPVIGLEIHVQLNTKSKLFSSAANRFGDEPNKNISEVCTGQPGSLPVLNEEALYKAVQFGLAVDANIQKYCCFDRKSYFYPDSPRNYQITQFFKPIIIGGTIRADVDGVTKEFQIDRAHLEDDAGMLKHFTNFSGVDYNRAGDPLLEIVSKPCMHSAKEAVAYAMSIKAIMQYINASDCNMEEGQLRMDVNVSVKKRSETKFRNKVEIKNMNSFTFMEMAIEAEIERQIKLYTDNPNADIFSLIKPSTYRFDPQKKELILMRSKESAEDYRYFPEPDIPPIILKNEYIQKAKAALPELPKDRFNRYIQNYKLSEYNASLLINDKPLCDYFEQALTDCLNPIALCNWITVEFVGRLKEKGTTLLSLNITPSNITSLVNMIEKNIITGKIAKSIADEMILNPKKTPQEIANSNPNYKPISDVSAIEPLIDQVLKENPQSVADYKNGKAKAFGFLVGQIMKLTKGQATPQIVNDLLKKKLDKRD